MEQQFVNYLRGYVRIRITGNSYDRFLNLCAFHGIRLWKLTPAGDSYEACLCKSDFKKLRLIVRKSHTRIRITGRYGLPFFIHRYRKRYACAVGAAAAVLLMAWLFAHVWNIRIDGNLSLTDDVIFEYLGAEGIHHGMKKSEVDTKKLSEDLRSFFPQLSWVSAELKGTSLGIYVKEGIPEPEEAAGSAQEETEGSSLAASKAGVVASIFVRRGIPAVSAGDTVETGDLLVSGAIPVYADDGSIAKWELTDADADILLKTQTDYRDEVLYETTRKRYTGREKTRLLIRIGRLPFSLPGSFSDFSLCEVTGELWQARLSAYFYLPLYLERYTAREYETCSDTLTQEEAEEILNKNLGDFIENLTEKGVQLFENDVTIGWYEHSAVASGVLVTGESAVTRTAANTAGIPGFEEPEDD